MEDEDKTPYENYLDSIGIGDDVPVMDYNPDDDSGELEAIRMEDLQWN